MLIHVGFAMSKIEEVQAHDQLRMLEALGEDQMAMDEMRGYSFAEEMKYVDEFRDPKLIKNVSREIARTADPDRHYRIMEVCGGHTHAIYRHGLKNLLPENVELIHGPGCPVCVLPMGRIDDGLARSPSSPTSIMTAFGDMMRVPGTSGTPLELKARGADIRMVYSPLDALRIAQNTPDKHVFFFAIGFETTAPSTALTLARARALGDPKLLRLLQSRDDRPGDSRDSRFTRHASRRVRWTGPRLDGDGLPPVRVHRARLRQAGGDFGFRAARHPRIDSDDLAAASRRRSARRKSISPDRSVGG